jgi:hypothetical protein
MERLSSVTAPTGVRRVERASPAELEGLAAVLVDYYRTL